MAYGNLVTCSCMLYQQWHRHEVASRVSSFLCTFRLPCPNKLATICMGSPPHRTDQNTSKWCVSVDNDTFETKNCLHRSVLSNTECVGCVTHWPH